MTKARNLADVISGNFDIPAESLDNAIVGDGDISTAKIADGAVTAAKIGSLPEGSVLQVVQGDHSTVVTSTSATFATTGLDASITPSDTSNEVLVSISMPFSINRSGNPFTNVLRLIIKRGSTTIADLVPDSNAGLGSIFNSRDNDPSTNGVQTIINYQVVDSPSTTSATTYSVEMASRSGLGTVYANTVDGSNASKSTITLMEIAGL